MKNYAVLLASGSGQRLGVSSTPKHLTKIGGAPCVVWTLNTLFSSNIFDFVVVVSAEDNQAWTEDEISTYLSIDSKKWTVTTGGSQRMDSFFAGLDRLREAHRLEQSDLIALVDANRPFIPTQQIFSLQDVAREHGCACPGRPIVNGVARVSQDRILDVPNKAEFIEFVTPEFISFSAFREESQKVLSKYKSLVEIALACEMRPRFIESSILNSKLTYPEDIGFLEGLIAQYKLATPDSIEMQSN